MLDTMIDATPAALSVPAHESCRLKLECTFTTVPSVPMRTMSNNRSISTHEDYELLRQF